VKRIRVYLVNDNRLLRESVRRLFHATSDIGLVGSAATAATAIEDLSKVAPHILLLQCNLSGGGCPCALRLVKARFSRLKVLMFGMSDDEEEFCSAIHCGATGYLLRDASTNDVLEAVRALDRNEAVIPKRLSLILVDLAAGVRAFPARPAFETAAGLTSRECQVVPLITARLTNKQIADRLSISEQTVKNHLRNILRKLNVKHRSEVAKQLAQASPDSDSRGLVAPPGLDNRVPPEFESNVVPE